MKNISPWNIVVCFAAVLHVTTLEGNEPAEVLLPFTNLTLNISVIDENREKVEEASVRVEFEHVTPFEIVTHVHEALSSNEGFVSIQEKGIRTFIRITKEGYWDTFIQDDGESYVNPETGWYFDNAVKKLVLPLRSKINPRPLFAHRLLELRLLELDTRYGFDLEKGDLVRPHGRGLNTDIILNMQGDVNQDTGEYDVRMVMSFPNEGDGILAVPRDGEGRSSLLLGQTAPPNGYQSTFELHTLHQKRGRFSRSISTPTHQEQSLIEGLWFRTHTVLDPNTGEILRARYGKIYSPLDYLITFSFSPKNSTGSIEGVVGFTYFYTPDGSPSLEFNGETLVPNGNLQGVDKR